MLFALTDVSGAAVPNLSVPDETRLIGLPVFAQWHDLFGAGSSSNKAKLVIGG